MARRLIMPGLAFVIVFGIYLASKLEVWDTFYVQWGLGASIVLGGLERHVLRADRAAPDRAGRARRGRRGRGEVSMSVEYDALARRLAIVGALSSLLVVVTIYFMATHTGT